MKDKKIKHYKCPKCGKKESAINCIPKCGCSGTSTKTDMEEISK